MQPRCLLFVTTALTAVLVPVGSATAGRVPRCFGQPATIVGPNTAIDLSDPEAGEAPGTFVFYEIVGTPGDDVIVGTSSYDTIFGRGGNDLVCALAGSDGIYMGTGDPLTEGDDRIDGGPGDDNINGAGGFDLCLGGPGHDTFNNCERTD
jgi:Ca2+-binding RTX toxin-like protein